MPLKPPKTPVYNCEYHRWRYWNHYDERFPVSGCSLSKDKFGCPYMDAERCPNYKPTDGRSTNKQARRSDEQAEI